jgi:AhpD family alkylhydroperoxidase
MEQRLNLREVIPEALERVSALSQHMRSRVDGTLLELLMLRASVLNGCAVCVDLHTTDAMKNGEDVRRLFAVSAWRESSLFTPAERAAFALTDAVTRLSEEGVSDDVWDPAVAAYGPSMAAELVVAIATINVWNRLNVTNHTTPRPL